MISRERGTFLTPDNVSCLFQKEDLKIKLNQGEEPNKHPKPQSQLEPPLRKPTQQVNERAAPSRCQG